MESLAGLAGESTTDDGPVQAPAAASVASTGKAVRNETWRSMGSLPGVGLHILQVVFVALNGCAIASGRLRFAA